MSELLEIVLITLACPLALPIFLEDKECPLDISELKGENKE